MAQTFAFVFTQDFDASNMIIVLPQIGLWSLHKPKPKILFQSKF
jgi:hypothetical protein